MRGKCAGIGSIIIGAGSGQSYIVVQDVRMPRRQLLVTWISQISS